MKTAKRVLSMVLVAMLLFSIFSVTASAASYSYGIMVPKDANYKNRLSTVKLYGKYDYINFVINCRSENTHFFCEIYSDSAYTKPIAYAYEPEASKCTRFFDLSYDMSELKSGTYYAVTYAAKIYSDGSYNIDKNSLYKFKIIVDRNPSFDKQIVVLKNIKNTEDGVSVSWYGVSGASKYVIYRQSNGSEKWVKVGTTTSKSYTDKSIAKKSGQFTYTVLAMNSKNAKTRYRRNGLSSYFVGAPKITSIKASGNNNEIVWNKISGATKYYVYRKVDGGKWSKIATVKSASYVDKKSKVSGTKYLYTIRAVRVDYSYTYESKCRDGKSAVFVTAPKVSSLSVSSDNRIVVKWGAVKNSTYDVYRKVSGGKWEVIERGFSGTTYYDSTAKENLTKYAYAVRATQKTSYGDVKGHYLESKLVQFVEMPSEVEIAKEETGVKLSWNAVEGAQSYKIFAKNINGEGSWVEIGVASENEFIDTESGIVGSRLYTVRADGAAKGSYSSTGFEYFNPAAPELSITGEDGSYTVSWEAVEGADSYTVYKKNADGQWELLSETSELSVDDLVTDEGVYSYSVVAKRGDMCGEFNDEGYSVEYIIEIVE